MKAQPIDYRGWTILISSLIIAALSSVNKFISLNYRDVREVYVLFFTNFLLAIICWVVIVYLDRVLLRIKKAPGLFWRISITSLGSLLVIFSLLIIISNFSDLHIFLNIRKIPHERYMPASIFRILVLIIAVQTIKYMFEVMAEKQKVLLENEILKREKLNAQFQSLKQQVNPHFLFNSLNTLKSLVKTNDIQAEEFVLRLSEVYRYILQTNQADWVAVREELNILEAYIFMLKARFEDSLRISIRVEEQVQRNMFLPPFTLQLLIENSIKHNIASIARPLIIGIFNVGDDELVVKNNLQPKKNVEESTGIGLENINKRCLFLSGNEINIVKNNSEFIVTLPLIRKHENSNR